MATVVRRQPCHAWGSRSAASEPGAAANAWTVLILSATLGLSSGAAITSFGGSLHPAPSTRWLWDIGPAQESPGEVLPTARRRPKCSPARILVFMGCWLLADFRANSARFEFTCCANVTSGPKRHTTGHAPRLRHQGRHGHSLRRNPCGRDLRRSGCCGIAYVRRGRPGPQPSGSHTERCGQSPLHRKPFGLRCVALEATAGAAAEARLRPWRGTAMSGGHACQEPGCQECRRSVQERDAVARLGTCPRVC